MKVVLAAKPGQAQTGIGRYVAELTRGLEAAGLAVTTAWPTVPLPIRVTDGVRRLV